MRNVTLNPRHSAHILRSRPLPGVVYSPSDATIEALNVVHACLYNAAAERELRRSYSLVDYGDTPMTERA